MRVMSDTGWFRSSFSSSASDACVEVRVGEIGARVRDSKNPGGGELTLKPATFAAFVAGAAATR
jgi:hypothetical protein